MVLDATWWTVKFYPIKKEMEQDIRRTFKFVKKLWCIEKDAIIFDYPGFGSNIKCAHAIKNAKKFLFQQERNGSMPHEEKARYCYTIFLLERWKTVDIEPANICIICVNLYSLDRLCRIDEWPGRGRLQFYSIFRY